MKDITSILNKTALTRRSFFESMGAGMHGAALLYLFGQSLRAEERPPVAGLHPRPPHFRPKAKSVIHLFMNGGPSQMDLFDPKPALDAHHGELGESRDRREKVVEVVGDAAGKRADGLELL